jgi:hypothetical protein
MCFFREDEPKQRSPEPQEARLARPTERRILEDFGPVTNSSDWKKELSLLTDESPAQSKLAQSSAVQVLHWDSKANTTQAWWVSVLSTSSLFYLATVERSALFPN